MAEVSLRAVEKRYQQDVAVLHGISCDIADGEFVVIVGPSGCGKSTLLRMIAGLETITAGEIAIGGRVVNDLEPKDRDIAMVFQNYALYPHMSVYDNMAYGLKIRGMSKIDIKAKVEQAADILQIRPYLDRKPRQLSGGQRQRVAMGRAIVRDPKVFLFDEPLSNLDAKLRVQMRVEIKHLQQRLGVTAVYVTHDQVEAMTLADRLVVMNAGRAEQIGAPLDLYARPETVFVAGFIGSPSMNFLPGKLSADGMSVEIGAGTATFALDTPMTAGAGRAVTVGIRPEHLVPADATAGPSLPLKVSLVEALGADTLVYGQPAGSLATTAADAPLVARLDGATAVKIGDQLTVRPTPGALHLFDAETGKRL